MIKALHPQRTYFISSCNNISEVVASTKSAKEILALFSKVTATKDYQKSSLIKIEGHLISQELLLKLLSMTVSDDIVLTPSEEQLLASYADKLRTLINC